MVNRIVVGAHYGLKDWLAQRITACVMAVYTVIFLVVLLAGGPWNYNSWKALFSQGWMRFATLLFILSLLSAQQVGAAHECSGGGHSLALPARKGAYGHVRGQSERLQRLVDALAPGPAIPRLDGALQLIEVALRAGIALRQLDDVGQSRLNHLEQRRIDIHLGLLRHESDGQAVLAMDRAVVEALQVAQHPEQR